MLEDDEQNLQETRHIPNEVSTVHQANFLFRENQKQIPTHELQHENIASRWLDHALRMPNNSLARVVLRWTPHGKRRRGRFKIIWRRPVKAELKEVTLT